MTPGRERVVIEGLKIDMSTEQLAARLTERIRWHQETVAEYDRVFRESQGKGRQRRSRAVLAHEMREHQEQVAVLSLIREHLVPGEVYRLTECDLRFADLAPDPYLGSFVPPRFDEESEEASVDS
jgi:hypothetical protein